LEDTAALKKADTGIAFGYDSEITRSAADIVILYDFAHFVDIVEQSRVMYENLKKSLAYSLSVNIAEMIPVLA